MQNVSKLLMVMCLSAPFIGWAGEKEARLPTIEVQSKRSTAAFKRTKVDAANIRARDAIDLKSALWVFLELRY